MKLCANIIYRVTFSLLPFSVIAQDDNPSKIFDVHLHDAKDMHKKLQDFEKYNIKKVAFSSSWDYTEKYRSKTKILFLFGLMFPCPNGIVPYSGQKCFKDGKDFPDTNWVRQQILGKKIDFLGELLNEYYGVSPADSIMFPYYALALKFNLPVGIHTGGIGPGNLSPNNDSTLGNPILMKDVLIKFPGIKVWIMHAGLPYIKETLTILASYPQVYADISVIANPDIVDTDEFQSYMKSLINAGFENRLMFGSDNGDYAKMIKAVNDLGFLSREQKEKIFYKNAEQFFGK